MASAAFCASCWIVCCSAIASFAGSRSMATFLSFIATSPVLPRTSGFRPHDRIDAGQTRDQNGHVHHACDHLKDCQEAGLNQHRSNVAESSGRERRKAEIDQLPSVECLYRSPERIAAGVEI